MSIEKLKEDAMKEFNAIKTIDYVNIPFDVKNRIEILIKSLITKANEEGKKEIKEDLIRYAKSQIIQAHEDHSFNDGVNAGMRYLINYLNNK